MTFKSMLSGQYKRVVATLIVGLTFAYFWIEGPLQERDAVINLESGESQFLIPKLIGESLKRDKNDFALIKSDQQRSVNFGLTGQNKKTKTFALIADQHNNPAMIKKVGKNMLDHAIKFQPSIAMNLKTAVDMFYLDLRSDQNNFKGIYLESTGLTDQIKGYAGPISIGLFISPEGKINSVNYISSAETSSYLKQIKNAGFYDQFTTIKLDGEKHELDAVSGATLSTEAMAATISLLLEKASESPLELYLMDDPAGTSIHARLTKQWMFHVAVLFTLFVFFWQNIFKRSRKRIIGLSIISILYVGFFLNNSFTYVSFLHPFMGVSVSYLVGFYCVFVLLGAIWNNNTYCKFVCPYGNVQRLITRLFPKQRRSFFISLIWVRRIRSILTLVILSGVILGLRNWSSYELFPDLFGFELTSMWFWLSLSLILFACFYPMIWCRLLCPTGEVLDSVSRLVKPSNKIQSLRYQLSSKGVHR